MPKLPRSPKPKRQGSKLYVGQVIDVWVVHPSKGAEISTDFNEIIGVCLAEMSAEVIRCSHPYSSIYQREAVVIGHDEESGKAKIHIVDKTLGDGYVLDRDLHKYLEEVRKSALEKLTPAEREALEIKE